MEERGSPSTRVGCDIAPRDGGAPGSTGPEEGREPPLESVRGQLRALSAIRGWQLILQVTGRHEGVLRRIITLAS